MEAQKSQGVRAFDVLVFGPLLIRLSKRLPGWEGEILFLFGAGAVVYNLANLIANERAKENPGV